MKNPLKTISLALAAVLTMSCTSAFSLTASAAGTDNATFEAHTFSVSSSEKMNYWLFTPENAEEDMPLIVYLHGMSQKGDDIDKLDDNGLCKWVSEGTFDDVPAYIIFPQLSNDYQGWKEVTENIKLLIEDVVETYDIDPDNVSLTGHSMGGIGTYAVANTYPELFSAVAPLSGSIVMTEQVVSNLSDIPLWAFVAKEDKYVNPNASISLVKALFEAGANAHVTVLDGATHFTVPDLVYLDEETDILGWLISEDKVEFEEAQTTVVVEGSGDSSSNTGTSTGSRPSGNKKPAGSDSSNDSSSDNESSTGTKPSGNKKPTGSDGSSTGSLSPNKKPGLSSNNQIILKIDSTEAEAFGEKYTLDAAPIVFNDRTMLPARFVAEQLGATVVWIGDKSEVVIAKDDIVINLYIDSTSAYVNGEKVTLESPAFVKDDRTYCPVRFICESLGATVEWAEDTNEVIITRTVQKKPSTDNAA